jgi:hypothetical protein
MEAAMNNGKWITILFVAILVLSLAGNVLAMSSPGYKLEWYVPVTGGGGGKASSDNFAVNFTVGQAVIGPSSSVSYSSGLGYWYSLIMERIIYLPIIFKDHFD